MQGTDEVYLFGKLLKEMRLSKGVSMHDMEKDLQISPAYLSRLERGNRRNPTMYIVGKLSKYFDIPITDIQEMFPEFFQTSSSDVVTLDKLILKGDFIFANIKANIDVKLSLQEIVKCIELYVEEDDDSRVKEAKLLQQIDKLRENVKSA
ncbi:MAG TPA: helix-turn-helix transcriptional regulator [Clostridium sp.]|uniref:helix-turn-helix domain-containing protein n=1 Tax=Clostridium sp. TaxID=1506 RepID=UPI002F94EFE9